MLVVCVFIVQILLFFCQNNREIKILAKNERQMQHEKASTQIMKESGYYLWLSLETVKSVCSTVMGVNGDRLWVLYFGKVRIDRYRSISNIL